MTGRNPKDRFTDRVDDYKKYRPGYPDEIANYLIDKCGLSDKSKIADIGSGTGIFSKILLDKGLNVIAVEPNDAMRGQAEKDLAGYSNFTSIKAGAEELPFEDNSIDLITAAQAFHWFDISKCKIEFRRVLKADSRLALVWNERLHDTPFLIDFEQLLKDCLNEYKFVDHKNITPEVIADFFWPNTYEIISFPINQSFNLNDYIGRVMSSSYAPRYGTDEGSIFIEALTRLFDKHSIAGRIEFRYASTVYLGKL